MRVKVLVICGLMLFAPLAMAKQGRNWKNGKGTVYQNGWYNPWLGGDQSGLPPGLAKRDRLPPGLEKHVRERGSLPPGLQKKVGSYWAPAERGYGRAYRENHRRRWQ